MTISIDRVQQLVNDFLKSYDTGAFKAEISRDFESWSLSYGGPCQGATGFMARREDAIAMLCIQRLIPESGRNWGMLHRFERFHGRYEFTGERFIVRCTDDGGVEIDPV